MVVVVCVEFAERKKDHRESSLGLLAHGLNMSKAELKKMELTKIDIHLHGAQLTINTIYTTILIALLMLLKICQNLSCYLF